MVQCPAPTRLDSYSLCHIMTYSVKGDRVGVRMDLENKGVSFYKNRQPIATGLEISCEPDETFFVTFILDPVDRVSIRYYGRLDPDQQ